MRTLRAFWKTRDNRSFIIIIFYYYNLFWQITQPSKRSNVHRFVQRNRWAQQNLSENRNLQGNQSKDMVNEQIKTRGLRINVFLAFQRWRCRPCLLMVPNNPCSHDTRKRSWNGSMSAWTAKAFQSRTLKMCSRNGSELGSVPGSLPLFCVWT